MWLGRRPRVSEVSSGRVAKLFGRSRQDLPMDWMRVCGKGSEGVLKVLGLSNLLDGSAIGWMGKTWAGIGVALRGMGSAR